MVTETRGVCESVRKSGRPGAAREGSSAKISGVGCSVLFVSVSPSLASLLAHGFQLLDLRRGQDRKNVGTGLHAEDHEFCLQSSLHIGKLARCRFVENGRFVLIGPCFPRLPHLLSEGLNFGLCGVKDGTYLVFLSFATNTPRRSR